MDNKGQPWGPAVVVFIYVYCIDINIEQLISCSNKHKLAPEKYTLLILLSLVYTSSKV